MLYFGSTCTLGRATTHACQYQWSLVFTSSLVQVSRRHDIPSRPKSSLLRLVSLKTRIVIPGTQLLRNISQENGTPALTMTVDGAVTLRNDGGNVPDTVLAEQAIIFFQAPPVTRLLPHLLTSVPMFTETSILLPICYLFCA